MKQRGKGSPCHTGGTAGKEFPPVLQKSPLLPNSLRVCRNSRLGTRGGSALLTDSSESRQCRDDSGRISQRERSVGGCRAPGNSKEGPVGKRLMPLPEQCPAWLCLSSITGAAFEGQGEGEPLSLLCSSENNSQFL